MAGTGHPEPPSCPQFCHRCSSICQELEPVIEPYAQPKVAYHFLGTKSGRLVLPEAAYIIMIFKNVLQTHLWKEARSRIVQKAVFLLAKCGKFYTSPLRTAVECPFGRWYRNFSERLAKTFSCKKPKALKFERRTGTLPRRTEDEFFSRRVLLSPSAPLSLASAPAAASASR